MPGTDTFLSEVSHVSTHGVWILMDHEELFLPFASFPWFLSATIQQISHIERPSQDHLYWPQLDIDLSVASIRDPGAFPLVAKTEPPTKS
jgi:hypothetical protein